MVNFSGHPLDIIAFALVQLHLDMPEYTWGCVLAETILNVKLKFKSILASAFM